MIEAHLDPLLDAMPLDEPTDELEVAPAAEPAPAQFAPPAPPAPPRPRVRSSFLLALVVVVVAWGSGLFGAWIGVRYATEREPARVASTLGLVSAEPRTDPLPPLDVFAAASTIGPSVVSISTVSSSGGTTGVLSGTGVVITSDGEIVTNAHVVEGAVTIRVRVPGETEARGAVLLATDPSRDIALLRIDADGLVPATFADPADIRVGDDVVAVGYALDLDGDPSVTVGIVSALNRTNADDTVALKGLIQTDAPISSGNSGGPLVNSLGQVVGITTFVALPQRGGTATNLGFAISNAEVLPLIDELRVAASGSLPIEGFLGVSLADRIDGGTGALVTEVQSGSPADAAGVEVGDAVVAIDDVPITGRAGLVATIRRFPPGAEVSVSIMRSGESLTVRATLAERSTD